MELAKATIKTVIFVIVLLVGLLQLTKGQPSCVGKTERFINGTCYTYYNESVTWQQAKVRCEEKDQVLASVDSKMQIDKIRFGQNIRTQVWLGANDIAEEGTFVWVHNNQTAVELSSIWRPNEPNNLGNEDCVVIFINETNDAPCNFNFPYFCMESPKKDVTTTTESITSLNTITPSPTVKTTIVVIRTTAALVTPLTTITPMLSTMSTMKTTTEVEKPLLSQLNIYIIATASVGFLLLVLAVACMVVCRRKGKRKEAITRHHVYDSYPNGRHDTVAYSPAGYAALNVEFTLNKKDSPVDMVENHLYDYIGGETPTEQKSSFK